MRYTLTYFTGNCLGGLNDSLQVYRKCIRIHRCFIHLHKDISQIRVQYMDESVTVVYIYKLYLSFLDNGFSQSTPQLFDAVDNHWSTILPKLFNCF
jgi:hypothetical protein